MSDYVQQFTDFLISNDLRPSNSIIPDDRERPLRQGGSKGKSRSAVYQLKILGDFAVGRAYCYKRGESFKWHSKSSHSLSADERRILKSRREAETKARDAAQIAAYENVSGKATTLWRSAVAPGLHDYAVSKKVDPLGVKRMGDLLIIPAFDGKGKIWSLQKINNAGQKFFMPGGKVDSCFCPIFSPDDPADKIIICEGWATGASLRMATGLRVVCAFNAGNMPKVAKVIRKKYPNAELILTADNDQWTTRSDGTSWNPGLEAAKAALAGAGGKGRICYPVFPNEHPSRPTDYNDLYVLEGTEAVKKSLASYSLTIDAKIEIKDNDGKWADKLIRDEKHKMVATSLANMILFFCHDEQLQNIFVYNEFSHETIVRRCPPWEDGRTFLVHRLDDLDIIRATQWLEYSGFKPMTDKVHKAIMQAASQCRIHPAREWFDALQWDGVKRLDNWLLTYCKAKQDDPEYLRAVGRKWMTACVTRVFNPGCKFDNMLVLEGPQNAGKSSVFRKLATIGNESYFSDAVTISSIDERDSIIKLQGKLIIEFAELSGFNQKDMADVKRWLTLQEDECRRPYGRENIVFKRQFITGGTHNPIEGWLGDPTGNRRFWPVIVGGKIDLEGLERDREQLWAEAVVYYRAGENLYLADDMYAAADDEQKKRKLVDPWTDRIINDIGARNEIKTDEILAFLNIDISKRTMADSRRVGKIMKSEGWEYTTRRGRNGKLEKLWIRASITGIQEEISW